MSSENEEEDEFEMGMTRRLPVATFTEYDPNVPPVSGADYLRRVQLETMKEPAIKVASDLAIDFNASTLTDEEGDYILDEFIKSKFALPNEIVLDLIESFEKLRSYMAHLRNIHPNVSMMVRRSRKWWREFCLGSSEDQKLSLTDGYQVKNNYQSRLPNMAVLCRLKQTDVYRLLEYHHDWIQEEFTLENGVWIYALLGALDPVQSGDTYSLLRQISRLCSQIRSRFELHLTEEKREESEYDRLSSLNLIILIIGHCFGQKDLLDSFSPCIP